MRPIWWVSSRTPTCVLFTPSVSQSCRRTSNSPVVFVERELKFSTF
ncbi:unnamed protein product [Heligmosomoides polygyrus]|uniref:Uncharacterized protein n=1 Tax=Heligmosomoides polygyrus TaxID=6339 RepID=A0A3P7U7W6_HELPZ|nr:unnamed protein product [Heligmosomoides polygyrus]